LGARAAAAGALRPPRATSGSQGAGAAQHGFLPGAACHDRQRSFARHQRPPLFPHPPHLALGGPPPQPAGRNRDLPARGRGYPAREGNRRPRCRRVHPPQPHLHGLHAAAALRRQRGDRVAASIMRPSPISASVDFDRDGVQHGFLKLPHSRDDSAWGAVMIPVSVIKRGEGRRALLTGPTPGEEYEGLVALFGWANGLGAEQVSGRVIIVPAMNYPAFRAGTRTSPIDKGNLNRLFPGRPAGTVTEKIADYFQRHLLPLADYVLDLHSGGRTLQFVPFAAAHVLPDKAQQAKCVAAMQAFNAPPGMMLLEIDSVGMYDTAAEEMGKVFVSTELGGGGSASAATVEIARRGVRNLLVHAGILQGSVERRPSV